MRDDAGKIAGITGEDAAAAHACAQGIAAESRKSDRWYSSVGEVATLLHHKNSLVRNRAISILAANARWDGGNRYDELIDEILAHVTDEKPITARQCIQALPEIAAAKPKLIPRIRQALERADFSIYRESMQPLLLKDAAHALRQIAEQGKKR